MTETHYDWDELRKDRDRWRRQANKYKAELADAVAKLSEIRRSAADREQRSAQRFNAIDGRF